MLTRLLTFMMVLCLFTVQANAATNNGLKAAFDDLNYSLTVDWNQTDRAFYDQQMQNFSDKINSLRTQGLTNQELVDFTISQVKDQAVARDLRTALTMVRVNKLTGQEALDYVTEALNKSYSRGASWGGEVLVTGLVLLVIIAAVAVAVASGNDRVTDDCSQVRTCDTYCTGGVKEACYTDCAYQCI